MVFPYKAGIPGVHSLYGGLLNYGYSDEIPHVSGVPNRRSDFSTRMWEIESRVFQNWRDFRLIR